MDASAGLRGIFAELVSIARTLRADGGCPWDREQTHATLVPYILEEAHEVAEAVANDDASELRVELGDLLFLILMMAAISEERGAFRLEEILLASRDKMIRRHPHVFGEVRVRGSAEVVRNWESIKRAEGPDRGSPVDGVPKTLSALLRARRVQEKAANVGFDWPAAEGVLEKIEEEVREIRERMGTADRGHGAAGAQDAEATGKLAEEVGDLLFSVVNLARFLRVNPEESLRTATEKFVRRFRKVEEAIARAGGRLSLEEMDRLWEEAKAGER